MYIVTFVLCKTIFCEEQLVSTPVGNIRGLVETISFDGKNYTFSKYLGIPYAKSTEGEGRFAKPVKKESFAETYNATEEKLACIQNPAWDYAKPPAGEDCLNLNIFVPGNAITTNNLKPVMLFIYGGGFQMGYQSTYGIGALPVVNEVIYVTINYRLSVFGFLAHSKYGLKGNYGLWDQHMAIQWVHDNIASFGGDQNRVTIFGESAGGASVTYQALYEENIGRFHRVISESGVTGAPWSYSDNNRQEKMSEQIIQNVGCGNKSVEATLQCLRMKSVEDFKSIIPAELSSSFLPVYDGEFIKYNPAQLYNTSLEPSRNALDTFSKFDAIIGVNSNESSLEMYYAFALGHLNYDIQFPDGVTPELALEFTKYNLKVNHMNIDDSVVKSMVHQYTDWADPKNPRRINEHLGGDLWSDFNFIVPATQALLAHAPSGKGNTYMYYFEHRPSYSSSPDFMKGANHMDEIPFALGFPESHLSALGATPDMVTHSEISLSVAMMEYWSQFARTG